MNWKYCPYCAGELEAIAEHVKECTKCGKKHYENPKSTVGIFLFDNDNQLVLSIRGLEPYLGAQDTIGGFVEVGETLEQGLLRELKEETGLLPTDITTPVYLASEYIEMDFMDYKTPINTIIYTADLLNDHLVASDDVVGFVRITKDSMDPNKFAWPTDLERLIRIAFKKRLDRSNS